ncbi:MAG: toxin-antitoxin system YwqK family antitoxin [Endomicrobium sp.]|jgi:antitoxin component YwqK of YwqJK toxin-antitoxin module|nr:toxin-antitoxin system YwqK family antitoxin [Endomicrobium sp.]
MISKTIVNISSAACCGKQRSCQSAGKIRFGARSFILSALLFFLLCQPCGAFINKKKVVTSDKEAFFIYTDEKGSEIAKERIFKDGKTELVYGFKINGEVRELDDNGSILYLWQYVDNQLDGICYKFYASGTVLYELTYKKDVLQGPAKKYYEDGSLAEEVIYINGKVEGTATVYLKNGNYYKYAYKDGKLNGKSSLYDKNNRLLETSMYKNNVLDGITAKYYLSGFLKSDMQYQKGKLKGAVRYYDEKGGEINYRKTSSEDDNSYDLSSAKKESKKLLNWNGPAQAYMSESRKMINEMKFLLKIKYLNGKCRSYYKNGKVRFEGNFIDNVPSGIFKSYSLDGKTLTVDNYVYGKLDGVSKLYYSTGEKLAQYRYKKGKISGISTVYNKDGSLISEVGYKNNLLHGTVKSFYDNGALCFEAYFSNGEPVGQLRYYFPDGSGNLKYLVEFNSGKICKSTSFSETGFVEYQAAY